MEEVWRRAADVCRRGVLTHDQVIGSLRLWAERVMPAFGGPGSVGGSGSA